MTLEQLWLVALSWCNFWILSPHSLTLIYQSSWNFQVNAKERHSLPILQVTIHRSNPLGIEENSEEGFHFGFANLKRFWTVGPPFYCTALFLGRILISSFSLPWLCCQKSLVLQNLCTCTVLTDRGSIKEQSILNQHLLGTCYEVRPATTEPAWRGSHYNAQSHQTKICFC